MMNTQLVVKVGVIPGAVNEFVLETGTTVAQALELANLTATGYDVRIDGELVSTDTVIPADASMIILAKCIKGNAIVIKVGIIPGAVTEFALEDDCTVGQALELANIASTGYDFRVDGELVTMDDILDESDSMLIGAKRIKGNASTVVLKVGVIPGAVNEFAVEEGTTIEAVLALANLSSNGYDVRLDGELVSLEDVVEEDSAMVILAKQIKGNAKAI